jgi:hypothetical protein
MVVRWLQQEILYGVPGQREEQKLTRNNVVLKSDRIRTRANKRSTYMHVWVDKG